ncbi:hypothetical protein HPB50_003749 [Hyalomma asiaticum]|uniref:Uncharacterized protein n=1 Tax=Hyalomma asiaticum TaxID=266040 RepID=A0ACB7SRG9_HYAAI|nr:hypothetical protein HPB50_003749 [Hyalomma asiaticum]
MAAPDDTCKGVIRGLDPRTGKQSASEEHDCEPTCKLCGGARVTRDRKWKQRFYIPGYQCDSAWVLPIQRRPIRMQGEIRLHSEVEPQDCCVEFSMCDISARMHCLAERRNKIGQQRPPVPPSFVLFPLRCALQTCGKLFQRATPRAFVWFAACPESSEETRSSLSPWFPPCATEPSDESYVAPSAHEGAVRSCRPHRALGSRCARRDRRRTLSDLFGD